MHPTFYMNMNLKTMLRLFKTGPNYLDDPILLLRAHLIITGQAKTSFENIHSNIFTAAFDIGVGPGSAVTTANNKGIQPVDRLHMHGFPDWASIRADGGDGLQNLGGAAFSVLRDIQCLPLSSRLQTHGILVDDYAAEPEIGNTVFSVKGIHFYR